MADRRITKRAVDEDAVCKGIEVTNDLGGIIEGVTAASQLVAKASEAIPVVGTAISAGIAIVNFFAGNALSSGCSDKPFDEIKKILGNRFDRVEKSLDRNFQAIKAVTAEVSKLRVEMQQGFAKVLQSIRSSRIEPLVLKLNSFIEFYNNEKGRIQNLPHDEYLIKLKEADNILIHLKASRMAMDDSLHTSLNEITDGGYAIPERRNDTIASNALHALCYGAQTYISIMDFLLDQYFYLAQYHYKKLELDEFNNYVDMMKSTFEDFKYSLIDISNTDAIIPQVISTLHKVESKYSKKCNEETICEFARKNIEDLNKVTEKLNEKVLPVILDTPDKFTGKIKFDRSEIGTPIGDWIKGEEVRYAVQYEKNGTYSKVGEWSNPFVIDDKANPFITLYFDPRNRNRLIFRKFNDETPQLVGIFKGEQGQEFRDINRELFNSASMPNENMAVRNMEVFVRYDADINAVFEDGKRVIHAAAEANNRLLTDRYILRKNRNAINEKDSRGYTPLHIAAEVGHEDYVTFLRQRGADVNAQTNTDLLTPLHIAAKKGFAPTITALLRSTKINIDAKDKNDYTPLHSAVAGGFHAVKALVSKQANRNAQNNEGLTPLHLAAMSDNLFIMLALFQNDRYCTNAEYCQVKPNIGNKDNMTALHFSSTFGHLEIVKYLMSQKDIDVNALSSDNRTSLHCAISFKRKEVAIELARNKDININLVSIDKIYPLHLAIETAQNDVAEELLLKGAEMEAKTNKGFTALHVAAKFKNSKMASILIEKEANIEAKSDEDLTPLHLAAESNDDETVRILLSKNADTKVLDKEGHFPIHKAAINGKLEAVRELIKKDSSLLEAKDKKGDSLLHLAVKSDNKDLIQYILDQGFDINIKNNDKITPLYYAIEGNNLELVQYLFERGANSMDKDDKNIYSIYTAVEKGFIDIVKFFVENRKVDINSRDGSRIDMRSDRKVLRINHFMLSDAVENNRVEIVKYLLDEKEAKLDDFVLCDLFNKSAEGGFLDLVKYFHTKKGVDLNCYSYEKYLPLYSAIENNHFEVMRYLVEQHAHIDRQYGKKLPLRSAIEIGSLEMVKYLIRKGHKIRWDFMDSPLIYAASSGHLEIVKYLIEEKNFLPDSGGYGLQTPLHKAAQIRGENADEKAVKIMKYLISKGADITKKDTKNKTPLDYASDKVKQEIQDYVNAKSEFKFRRHIKLDKKENNLKKDSRFPRRILTNREKKIEMNQKNKSFKNVYSTDYISNFDRRSVINNHLSHLIESTSYKSEPQMSKSMVNNTDLNSTLLLLDVLIKKLTGEKQNFTRNHSPSKLEAQGLALTIANKFEDLLNSFSHQSVKEQINMHEVYSNIVKGLMTGEKSFISKLLCSYAMALDDMKPDKIEELFGELMHTKPVLKHKEEIVTPSGFGKYLPDLLTDFCKIKIA